MTVTTENAKSAPNEMEANKSSRSSVFMHELMMKDVRNGQGLTTKRRILKNLLVISTAWMLLFSAFQALTNLQSSLNKEAGLGIGAAPLWAAKCAYLTATGSTYADVSFETPEAVISRFFGIFFAMFQTSQIWGNIIASTVLNTNGNSSLATDSEIKHCGATFCDQLVGNATNLQRPDTERLYLLMAIYTGCSVFAMIVIIIFLDPIPHRMKENQGELTNLVAQTFRHLRHKNQILIIPLTIYSGMEQGFVGGDFTKAYVSCSLGIWMVGYVMICYGVVDVACSYLFGKLVKYVGRLPCFTGALYGCIFAAHEQEAAFTNYRMWESIGFIIAFAYSSFLCTNIKLYILMSMLALGTAGYCAVEVRERRRGAGTISR